MVSQQGSAQETFTDKFKYKATYDITYQPDSTDVKSVRSEEMVLYLSDKISRFSSLGKALKDSLMANRDKSNKNMEAFARLQSQIPKTKFDYYIYKGIPEGKTSFTREVVKDDFRYVEESDLFNWNIHPETKEIAGYQAQKATTHFAGREYVAWFTTELPFPDGPYKFNGLPGLIVELMDQKGYYSFMMKEFKYMEPLLFNFDSGDYITTSKIKLKNVLEEYNRDPFAAMARNGITIGFQPGQKESLEKERKEQLRKENNPIELE